MEFSPHFAKVVTVNEEVAKSKGLHTISAVYIYGDNYPVEIFGDREFPQENSFYAHAMADKLNASAQEWFDHVKFNMPIKEKTNERT